MTKKYSVKAARKRWPIHVFYNVIDQALIKSWILFRVICKSRVSCRKFAQRVDEELKGTPPGDTAEKNAVAQRIPLETNKLQKKNEKLEQPLSALIEQWIRATLARVQ